MWGRLNTGENIQMLTALFLQLIQSAVKLPSMPDGNNVDLNYRKVCLVWWQPLLLIL